MPAYDKLNSILEEANITMLDSDEPAAIPIAVRYGSQLSGSSSRQGSCLHFPLLVGYDLCIVS